MDRVRFGRALGVGAREAAKAMLKAADAAAAPNPRAAGARPVERATAQRSAVGAVAGRVEQAKAAKANLKRGGKGFGKAVWGPVAKASGVLWLEVTGVLFGLFAAVAGVEVWREHGALLGAAGTEKQHAWWAVVMFVVFGYFTVSSYARAAKKSRG